VADVWLCRPYNSRVARLNNHNCLLRVEFYERVKANAPRGIMPPVATTDGVNFDRQPGPEELAALLAYLRKLWRKVDCEGARHSIFGLERSMSMMSLRTRSFA
jgi:hypothetical protein